jgi:hypothetical protein
MYAEHRAQLNMIIGPNGTGKSSIVCAIAIGLAFSPKVLGRSDNVADFVKKGHTHGWVEIELKGKPGQRNVVVKRTIDFTEEGVGKKAKAGVQSKFFLNGASCQVDAGRTKNPCAGAASTEKAVKAKVKGLGIDVNNLWYAAQIQSECIHQVLAQHLPPPRSRQQVLRDERHGPA